MYKAVCEPLALLTPELYHLSMLSLQMETSAQNTHEYLESIIDFQTHHRMRETQGRAHAENLNEVVQMWALVLSAVIFFTGLGQVIVLRSFFTEKRTRI